MLRNTPIISKEQETVLKWASRLQEKHISFSTVIEFLVTDKKCRSTFISEGLKEARVIYERGDQASKAELLKALVLDHYRLRNDVREGHIVTNGVEVGFACNVDYKMREFQLSAKKDGSEILGFFSIDGFKKV